MAGRGPSRLNGRKRSRRRTIINSVALVSAGLYVLVHVRYLGGLLSRQGDDDVAISPRIIPLGIPENNVNETFPLRLLKGSRPSSTDPTTRRNTTLVVVWGSVRSTDQAWQTMYRNVLDVHSADLALIIQDDPGNDRSSSLYSHAKYIWEYHAFQRWDDAVDLVGKSQDTGKTWRDFAKRTQIALGGTDVARKGSGAVLFLHRWFASNCIEELLPYYDTFVFTRSDHVYFCPDPVDMMRNGSIWIPVGEDWGGITDRHLVCGRDDVMTLLDILPPIVEHPARQMELLKQAPKIVRKGWQGGIRNTETLLKLSWVREGVWDKVRRYPRNMVISATLKQNNVGWAKPAPPNGTAGGLFLKYPAEYNEMKDNGCNVPGPERYDKGIPNWLPKEEGHRPYHCDKCKKHKLGCLEACNNA